MSEASRPFVVKNVCKKLLCHLSRSLNRKWNWSIMHLWLPNQA